MKLSGGGSIVNIAGVSGLTGNAGRSAYGASKGGVVMLSKAMATDLAPLGIRVNVIAPGPVESPLAELKPSPHARKRWTDAIPLERGLQYLPADRENRISVTNHFYQYGFDTRTIR
jgi:NAD(P)-dependent dehydrogenase (short-subunit alcohol dehydrogenase family)